MTNEKTYIKNDLIDYADVDEIESFPGEGDFCGDNTAHTSAGHSILAAMIVLSSTMIVLILAGEAATGSIAFELMAVWETVVDAILPIFATIGFVTVAIVLAAQLAKNSDLTATSRGCGCGMTAPETRSEIVETSTEWRRDTDGAKVVWKHVERQLRRCEECGGHFHADDPEVLERREAWPENEPEILPEDEELMTAEWNTGPVIKDE